MELPSQDALGCGICNACLWKELSETARSGIEVVRHMVDGHEILSELGRGGMAVVYRARQFRPTREVAVKMLQPLDCGEDAARERFYQEALTLAGLKHPAILPVYQVGEADGMPYFTMQLATGGTLAQRLRVDGTWLPRRAAELMIAISSAIHYAHCHGILHRDIKPGNILFGESGNVYVADFGLAKLEESTSAYTKCAAVLGTPEFMAPEIAARGTRAATIASDVYSLGAMLYELLTGRPPFYDESVPVLLRMIAESEPDSPSTLNSRIPRDLEVICLKCLRKSPRERYASADALAADLGRWIAGEPILARQITPLQRLTKWARRRPGLAALSAALVLVAGGSAIRQVQINRQLTAALELARDSQARADQRAEFFLGRHARALETIGRLDLLNEAYADVLATDTGDDERSRRRRADVLTRMGEAFVTQNRHGEAVSPLRKALDLAESLPDGPDRDLLIARSGSALARVVAETISFEEATSILARVENRLNPEAPGFAAACAEVAEAYTAIGLTSVFSHPDVLRRAEEAVRCRRAILDGNPDDRDAALQFAKALQAQGEVLWREANQALRDLERGAAADGTRNPAEEAKTSLAKALGLFEEALALARRMAETPPVDAQWELQVADNLGWIAEITALLDPPNAPDNLALRHEQRRLVERAVARDRLDWRSRSALSSIYEQIATTLAKRNDPAGEDEYRQLHETEVLEINRQAPTDRRWMLISMNASLTLGNWHLTRARRDDAKLHFGLAWDHAKRLVGMRPDHLTDRQGFLSVEDMIRRAWRSINDTAEIRAHLEDGIAFVRRQAEVGSTRSEYLWMSAHFERRLADLCRDTGDLDGMLNHNLSALATRVRLLRERATPAVSDPYAVPGSFLHSERSHIARREIADAVELGRQALEVWNECASLAVPLNPNRYWAEAIVTAARAGREAGGATGEGARQLAAQALRSLYGVQGSPAVDEEVSDASPRPEYQPRPDAETAFRQDSSRYIAELSRLAAPDFAPGVRP